MAGVLGKIRRLHKRVFTERERIIDSVKNEDFLIKQIDEFKEKAQQLQQLLDTKENRVQELQHIVEEREQKARNLHEIVQVKQQEADKITKGVEGYVNQIVKELNGQIAQLQNILTERNQENGEQLKSSMDDSMVKVDAMKVELSEKLDAMKVELSKKLDIIKDELSEKQDAIKDELSEKQDAIKGELSEKIHTENVKSYRNMQSLIEELEKKQEEAELGSRVNAMKGYMKAAIVIGVVNFLAVVGVLVYELGVWKYFM